jgi:hypothetical protein
MTDYKKLDAALATALESAQDPEAPLFSVFIHTEPTFNKDKIAFLEKLGVKVGSGEQLIFTGTFSARIIGELSEQPWVRYLKLSRKLRLLNDPK